MLIAATCSTIAAMLAYASGGDTITLTGHCGLIEIKKTYTTPLIINAEKARVRGLVISGRNVVWQGGTLSAPGTLDTTGPNGYAVKISGRDITLRGATITAAKKGMVIDGAQGIRIERNNFWRVREDGIIASDTKRLTVVYNQFSETLPLPSKCIGPDGVIALAVPQRDCRGTWIDGSHADAVQMRNGIEDALIANNGVLGPTSGITQMDTIGDRPLRRVVVEANRIITDAYHRITLDECFDCVIRNNNARKVPGTTKRVVILPGRAMRCGNYAEDERVRDAPCRAGA